MEARQEARQGVEGGVAARGVGRLRRGRSPRGGPLALQRQGREAEQAKCDAIPGQHEHRRVRAGEILRCDAPVRDLLTPDQSGYVFRVANQTLRARSFVTPGAGTGGFVDTWILQMIRRSAHRQITVWVAVLAIFVAVAMSNRAYIKGFFQGPRKL